MKENQKSENTAALICRVRENDQSAFAALLSLYEPLLHAKVVQYASGLCASDIEDLRQVALLAFYRAAKSFDLAKERLTSLPAADYVSFRAGLVKQAAPNCEGILVLNETDRTAIGEQLLQAVNAAGGHFSLSNETRDMAGGFLLRSGSVETNCSIELLLDLCKNELTHQLAELLFR